MTVINLVSTKILTLHDSFKLQNVIMRTAREKWHLIDDELDGISNIKDIIKAHEEIMKSGLKHARKGCIIYLGTLGDLNELRNTKNLFINEK